MAAPIVAHQRQIGRIFSNDYVFNIPSYQRPYAWTPDQAEELFDDLYGAMNAIPVPVTDLPPYFLGSIVLIKSEEQPPADVVDGQQRLTTLVLLLSAIRSVVEATYAGEISPLIYESGSVIMGTTDRFRLTLRPRDAEFFKKYVQKEEGFAGLLALEGAYPDSQANLIKNARLFHKKLTDISADERIRLAQFIVTRCYLVAVSTPDLDSAYRIFSVLNSRGLDLSATDILKAEIIGALSDPLRPGYTEKWEEIEEELGREKFGELFSHIRMVYRKAKPQGTLLKEFRDHVSSKNPADRLIDEIIRPMANVYEFLTQADYEAAQGAEAVNEPLKWLNRLEFVDWLPPAMAFAVRHKDSPAKLATFLADLERLSYGMLLMKFSITDRIERFAKLIASIEEGQSLEASRSPLQLRPNEQFRVYQALGGRFYETFAARARTTVLLRLDSLLAGAGAKYDYAVITVEHVLPQNPKIDSLWMEWIPEATDRLDCVHQLGNLALLTRKKNSKASNYDFERKKTAYFSTKGGVSPFALTTQVLACPKWTKDHIFNRQAVLIDTLVKHWRLDDRKDIVESILADAAPE